MSARAFITPLPRLAASLLQSALQRARRWQTGKLPAIPDAPLAVELQGLGLVLEFSADPADSTGRVSVTSQPATTVETVIQASPASLALQAANGVPGGRIEIQGNASLAQRWQQYFAALNPDWEQALSARLGPVAGYQLAQVFSQLSAGARQQGQDSAAMVAEYLQEEARWLVTRVEMQQFLDAVDDLTERTERLLARYAAGSTAR